MSSADFSMAGAGAVTTKNVALFGLVIAGRAIQPTVVVDVVGNVTLVAIRSVVASEPGHGAAIDIAGDAMELFSRQIGLTYSLGFRLLPPGAFAAKGSVLRRRVRAELAIRFPLDSFAPFVGEFGHEIELIGGETDVVHALHDAFQERIVSSQTTPNEVFSGPRTGAGGEAVRCRFFVHGPEHQVECCLDGDESCPEYRNMCRGRHGTPS